jgi:hypothetical protein
MVVTFHPHVWIAEIVGKLLTKLLTRPLSFGRIKECYEFPGTSRKVAHHKTCRGSVVTQEVGQFISSE